MPSILWTICIYYRIESRTLNCLGFTIPQIFRNIIRRFNVVLGMLGEHKSFLATDPSADYVSCEEGWAGFAGSETSVGTLSYHVLYS